MIPPKTHNLNTRPLSIAHSLKLSPNKSTSMHSYCVCKHDIAITHGLHSRSWYYMQYTLSCHFSTLYLHNSSFKPCVSGLNLNRSLVPALFIEIYAQV